MKVASPRRLATLVLSCFLVVAARADAATGTCDVSPGDYTAWTGTDAALATASTATSGVSEARCMKLIRTLGSVVEGVFRDSKGRYADELPTFGKAFNMYPGETFAGAGQVCAPGFNPKGGRNVPGGYTCVTPAPTFAILSDAVNALDWKWTQGPRYDPAGRSWCADPTKGCFGGRCYDAACVKTDGTLTTCPAGQLCKAGACVAGDPTTLPTCTTLDVKPMTTDGSTKFYDPWNALVFDLGGLSNKVAIFAVNDHGPQPCESNEYTVYLTNNPYSREVIDNPGKDGADPTKWNRAKLYKIFTHGWIDNPDCCDSPKTCDPTKCTLPAAGDAPKLESDSMALVFTLPCGIAFRYAATISGYDGKSLTDPALGPDACEFNSYENEVDAVAGLNDDESAICPDKDGDGFPTCDCAPEPCDCVDDPTKNPEAKKYHPGAPQACDGPEYSCKPTPCPVGSICYLKQCLKPCAGELSCPAGSTCTSATVDGGSIGKVCVPSPCGDAGVCDPGFLCVGGKCVDPCGPPTVCPFGQACADGKCSDPCALIKCPAGQKCQGGLCHDSCVCLAKSSTIYPCKGALPACDPKTGLCAPAGCETTSCPPDKHCESVGGIGKCVGPCEGVVCPKGYVCDDAKGCATPCDLLKTPCGPGTKCKDGTCVDDACFDLDCPEGFVCTAGKCVDPSASDLSLSDDAGGILDGSFDTGVVLGDNPSSEQGSCGCVMVGAGGRTSLALGTLVFTLGALARRKRRNRRP